MKIVIILTSLLLITAAKAQNLQNGLVAHFPLDANGDDISITNIDGVLSGCSPAIGAYGQPMTALNFSMVQTDFIECGTSNRGISNQFSISVWMKSTSTATNHIVSKYDWVNDGGFYVGAYQNKMILAGRDGSGQFIYAGLGTTTINDGVWHHVVATCDGYTWNLYVDCNLETTITMSTSLPSMASVIPLSIGYYSYGDFGDYRYFDGDIDDARLYNRVLTSLEIPMLCDVNLLTTPIVEIDDKIVVSTIDANGLYNISWDNKEELTLEIYNLNGQLVFSKIGKGELDLRNQSTGMYFLCVINEDGQNVYNQKIIKN